LKTNSSDKPAKASFDLRWIGALAVSSLILGLLGFLWGAGQLSPASLPEATADSSLWIILMAGASVGGLSCLAVQGGLLAAVIAQRESQLRDSALGPWHRMVPIGQFLGAKVAAYSLLGATLGAFGAKIPLALQGWLLVAVGLFMIVTVLQLYDVHPILRRLTVTPPKRLQRQVRRESKSGTAAAPLLVGAMTVFVPCGVTIAMEFLAVASHSALRGAAIMMAFTSGTVPTFLVAGVLATQLGRRAYPVFKPLAALAVGVIGAVAILSGGRLLGVRMPSLGGGGGSESLSQGQAVLASPQQPVAGAQSAVQEATVLVSTGAYRPERVTIQPNVPTRLRLVTDGTRGCIRAFVIPSLSVERLLPETGTEVVELPPSPPGASIPFMCSMGMFSGVIEVSGS
jgi:sulfite exporter TauE/SafE